MSVLINSNTGFWTWDTNWQTNNNIEFTPSFAYFEKDSIVVSLILSDNATITVPSSYYSISPSSPFKVIVNFLNFFNANGVASAATKAQVYIYRAVPYSLTLPPTGSITPEMLYNELYRFLALIFDATSGGANIIPPPAVRAYSDFSFDIDGSPIANKNYALRRWAIDFPHKANTWVEYNGGLYKVKNNITINGSTPDLDTTNYQCFIEPGGFVQKYNNLDRLIYSSTLTYLVNETVMYNGHWWEATTTVSNVTPGFGVSQWRKTTVGVWFATYNYLTNENTLGSNGMLYRAKQNNSGQDPTTDTAQTYWEPVGSSSQSSSNFFADETFTGKATWTGTSTFVINTSSLLIGDNTEGKFTGVGYRETAITIPKAARGETVEISFDGYLGGTTPTATLSLTDGAALPVAHNGSVISQLGKSRFFAKLVMTDNATLNLRLTFAGTSPDFRIQNLVVQREKTIFGAAVGPWQNYPAGTYSVSGVANSVTITEGKIPAMQVTTNPVKGTGTVLDIAEWKQDGEDLLLHFLFACSIAGTNGSGNIIFPLPTGKTMYNNGANISNTVSSHTSKLFIGDGGVSNTAYVGELSCTPTGANSFGLVVRNNVSDTSMSSGGVEAVGGFELFVRVKCDQFIGKNIVQLAQSAGPLYLANTTTTDANDSTDANTYMGADGSTVPSVTTSAKTKRVIHRALLPNEVRILEFRHASTKTWIASTDLVWQVTAGYYASVGIDSEETNTAVNSYGAGLLPIDDTHTDVVFLANASRANSVNYSWATFGAVYDRYRVRIGPQNAVELPPTVYAKYEKLSGGAVDDSMSASDKVTDTHSFINGSKEWVVPMDGTYHFTMNGRASGNNQCGVIIFKNGTEIANVYMEMGSPDGLSTSAIEQCNKGDLIKFTWHLQVFQKVRATLARLGPK